MNSSLEQSNFEQTVKLQQLASNPKNSAWVFASAGSGKTKILVDRVLRFLLEDVKPDKILCLTFTKVAASEMQNRINLELSKWVSVNDDELTEKLTQLTGYYPKQSDLIKSRTLFTKTLDEESKIKIQTIHSFCQNLAKIFPFEIGINPNFEVMEQSQEKLLLQKSQREVLKRAEIDDSLKDLVTQINARLHEESFNELISNLLNKKEQLALLKDKFFGIEGVIEEVFKGFSVSEQQNEEDIFSNFLSRIDKDSSLKLAIELEKSALVNNGKVSKLIKTFLSNPILENFPSYKEAFFTKTNGARKLNGKIMEKESLSRIADEQRVLISEFLDKINSYKICNSTALLLSFIDHILGIYSNLKHQNSFLDYNDLIIQTNKLLNNPDFSQWVKLKMDGLFDHILIDESQDTNHQQWNIIKSLTEDFFSGFSASEKNRTIFIVGDEKQSIYSFQGAEPNISQEIFSYFEEKLRDNPSKLYKIDLNNSFRSLETILDVVDSTFSSEEQKAAISKINEFTGHKAIRKGLGRFEMWPQIKMKSPEKNSKENSDKSADYNWKIDFLPQDNYQEQEFLAEFIAIKIKESVSSGQILEGRERALNYSDFMILLRNRTNGFDKSLSKFFQKYGIPNSSSTRVKFANNILIQDLLSAAKFSLLPTDDLNLACLLKSPIFDFSEEKLLEACKFKNDKKTTLFDSLKSFKEHSNLIKRLKNLIKISQDLTSFEFFNLLLNGKDFKKTVISRFGSGSLQILDQFSLKVLDFCQNFSPNLQQFLEFVEKLDPEISLLSQKNNQVCVTTIHSAKGLQAPIVIIPDSCFNFNRLPSSKEKISWIEFSQDKLPVWCVKKDEENQLLKNHRQEKLKSAKDEYSRLLYVAMTRAENELYIGGFGNSNDDDSWYNLVKNGLQEDKITKEEDFFSSQKIDIPDEKFSIQGNSLIIGQTDSTHQKIETLNEDVSRKLPKFLASKELPEEKHSSINESASNQINKSQIRGKLIHKILEIIANNSQEDQKWLLDLAKMIISREEILNKEESEEILTQISEFISSEIFKELFSLSQDDEIKCEVPIIGMIDNEVMNVRIDLLIVKKDEILIVDYKTDKLLPKEMSQEIPTSYVNQLRTYEKLVKDIYKTKVRSAILWMESFKLEFLP